MNGQAAYADWIALEWAPTTLRAWAMQSAGPRASAEAPAPADPSLASAEAALLSMIEPWLGAGVTEIVACGAIPAAPDGTLAACPAVPARALDGPLLRAPLAGGRLDLRLVPGLSQTAPPDVMRGPETAIAGFLTRHPGWDGIVCLPGPHSVWAELSAGEVVSFRSAMTGELFSALSRHTVLKDTVGTGWDEAAFADALSDAMSRPEALAGRLIGLHAAAHLQGLSAAAATAQLSGMLIGLELAATRPYWLGREVTVIARAEEGDRYLSALRAQSLSPALVDRNEMTLTGLAKARAR